MSSNLHGHFTYNKAPLKFPLSPDPSNLNFKFCAILVVESSSEFQLTKDLSFVINNHIQRPLSHSQSSGLFLENAILILSAAVRFETWKGSSTDLGLAGNTNAYISATGLTTV
jgi:hypothetical protein